MKKLVLIAVFLIGFSIVAGAQGYYDYPAYQFFGGYSNLHNQTVDPLTQNVGRRGTSEVDMNGWNLAIAINGNKRVAAVVDMSGHYGKISSLEGRIYLPVESHNFKSHSVMFGPKVNFTKGKITPFVQSLLGDVHTNIGGESTYYVPAGPGRAEQWLSGNRHTTNNFAVSIGGGLDIAVNDKLGVRVFQADYFWVRTTGFYRDNVRVSTGITWNVEKR